MALFLVIYIIFGIGSCLAAPANKEDNTFFSAISSVCNNSDLLIKQKEIFDNCKNFKEINKTVSLTPTNEKNVLCALYYDRIISCCRSHPKTINYPTLKNVTTNDVESICNNITEYSKSIFPKSPITKNRCFHLCTEVSGTDTDDIRPECLYAHYYHIQSQKPDTPPIDTNKLKLTVSSNTNIPHQTPITNQSSNSNSNLPQSGTQPGNQLNAVVGNGSNIVNTTNANVANIPILIVEDNKKIPIVETVKVEGDNHQVVIDTIQGRTAEDEPKDNPDAPGKADVVPKQNLQIGESAVGGVDGLSPTKDLGGDDKLSPPTNSAKKDDKPNSPKKDVTKTEPAQIKEDQAEPDIENEGLHGIPDTNGDSEDYPENVEVVPKLPDTPPKQEAVQEVTEHKILDKKPDIVQDNPVNSENIDDIDGESYFFSYFMVICVLFVLGYVGYHNRIKVMALLLEGKRNKRQHRGKRPNSANYHKLDSNLEEAISSNVTKNSNNVIY